MDIQQLKKNIVIRASVYLFVIVGLSAGYYYLNQYLVKVNETLSWLENDIKSVKGKIEGLNQRASEFSEAVKIWESLDENSKRLQGLRINDSKDLLDQYKNDFLLSHVTTQFSKPSTSDDEISDTETIDIISSNITISFKAITDELALQFVDTLYNQFPGFIYVNSFSLTRESNVTKVVLKDIARGDKPPLVKGEIDFSWKDIKHTPSNDNGGER